MRCLGAGEIARRAGQPNDDNGVTVAPGTADKNPGSAVWDVDVCLYSTDKKMRYAG